MIDQVQDVGHHLSSQRNFLPGQRLVPQTHEEWEKHKLLKRVLRNGQKEEAKLILQEEVFVNVNFELASSDYCRVTPLHLAVHLGCLDLIKNLLDLGASVNAKDSSGESPLSLSVRLRKYSITDLLLTSEFIEVSCKYRYGIMNHLHIACLRKNISVVKRLIALGSDVNKQIDENASNYAGWTPLHFAVESHAPEIVQLLVDSGASINKKNSHSITPLHLADEIRDDEIIDILLAAQMFELGNPENGRQLSHFHIACTRNNVNVVKFFLQQGVDVNSPIASDSKMWAEYEPLKFAIYYECADVVEMLLAHKAELRRFSSDDGTHLRLAYDIGNEKIINILLSYDFKKRIEIYEEPTDFQMACVEDYAKKVETMLLGDNRKKFVSQLNLPISNNGSTPLHFLVKYLSSNAIETIRKFGGNVSMKDARGKTPLHILFDDRHWIAGSTLLNLVNFEENPVNEFGLSHFHIACTVNSVHLIEKFLENRSCINKSVDRNSPKWPSYSPLHFAVKFDQREMVTSLLENGADISLKDAFDFTPFDIAIIKLNDSYRLDNDPEKLELIQKMLLIGQRSADFNSRGFTLFHTFCATHKKKNMFQFSQYADMLTEGIDQTINFPSSNYHQNTPLHFAMDNGNVNIVMWLIEKGANVYLKNSHGFSPLQHEISSEGEYGILLKNPALLCVPGNPFDSWGYSYFHLSCMCHDKTAMEYHLNSGVDINLKTKTDVCGKNSTETPLQSVLRRFNYRSSEISTDTVRFLIDNGADVMARDAFLNTPLHCMKHCFNKDVMELLIDHGAQINAVNVLGETVLFHACRVLDTTKKIKFLLKHGADINIENDQGYTPLTDTCTLLMNTGYSHDKVILTLLKHVKKLEVAGLHVSVKNTEMYAEFLDSYDVSKYDELAFEEECLKEIELMKNIRINQYTTLYSIMFKTSNQMAYLSRNATFHEITDSNDFESKFPNYGYLVKLQQKKGFARELLLEKCTKSLCSMVKFSSEYAEKILDYLDDIDLKNIIKSETVICNL
ncbi:hypothetical protein QAD02_005121 [Eretmocerus hayati]|uniref:Uncharacterized protein n=1 Tax=Eretmocerus hayati TaxID=131215 RepID=A0ACC2NRY5_9HYME|nr:hypothetical protein QAD02_005121 [Eretmocerus hayati]